MPAHSVRTSSRSLGSCSQVVDELLQLAPLGGEQRLAMDYGREFLIVGGLAISIGSSAVTRAQCLGERPKRVVGTGARAGRPPHLDQG
jgi:hypothetical protein